MKCFLLFASIDYPKNKLQKKGCSTALAKCDIDAWSRAEMFKNLVHVLTNGKAANWGPEVAWIPFWKRCAVFA